MTSAALLIQPNEPQRAALENLSDVELHVATRRLTARSNITLAELLAHLGEVESRGIHRERACASLYTYCIYELRMSEDAAFRRAKAARVVHQHPELQGVLARGELHLTALLMVAPYLGGERHREILERARFRTKREIARLIAEIDSRPAVPAQIAPIAPAPAGPATHRAYVEALAGPVRSLPEGGRPGDWIDAAHGQSAKQGPGDVPDEALFSAERAIEGARDNPPAPEKRPMSYEVRFTATQEYVDLIDEALDLLGGPRQAARLPEIQLRAVRELVGRLRRHRKGAATWSDRVERRAQGGAAASREEEGAPAPARVGAGADEARRAEAERAAPARVAAGADEARRDTPGRDDSAAPHGSKPRSRYITAAVRRVVWERDGSRCAYVDARGRRCAETGGLEVHHRRAYARGGPGTVDNLELRCRSHNALAAEADFGRDPIRR